MELAQSLVGPSPAALSVERLSWGPPRGAPIVHDLSFTVAPGEMLALVGPNGAGKSSLLRCLYRYHRPTAGTVRLDGADLWQLDPRATARRIATVLTTIAASCRSRPCSAPSSSSLPICSPASSSRRRTCIVTGLVGGLFFILLLRRRTRAA